MMNDKRELLELMLEGATVITPNKRLSADLLCDFFKAYPQDVQAKPRCMPYSAFLQDCFKKYCHQNPQQEHPILLTTQQHRYLWRQILAKTELAEVNEGLLQALEEAWTRCQLWCIDFNHPTFSYTPQTRQFQHWALSLEQRLQALGAISEAQLASYLVQQKSSFKSTKLIWFCFDDYNPQQRALHQHFSSQGFELLHYDLAEQPSEKYCYAAKDENEELEQLSHWLKERLAIGEQRIAVVVPDLQARSQRLQRLLQQQLPATEFNISLGQPLNGYPLVAHAFTWLSLDGEKLDIHQARMLLHSPYLAHSQAEMLGRAQFMEESPILQELYFKQAVFVKALSRLAPKLAEVLKSLESYPEEASIEAWIKLFKARLIALGFPGEYPLNSATYQCYQRFLNLFDEFKQLTPLTSTLTRIEALNALKNIAKTTVFQPKKASAKIQILGLLEASGCSFDSLWLTGLTDQCLPQKPKLSAFIPIAIQRDKLMPHASPTRELELAQKILKRLGNSSAYTVFSYPCMSDDSPNLPSPLLLNFASLPTPQLSKEIQPSALIMREESFSLPFAEEETATGGTAILANQAKCPFRAFAAHRLHAKAFLSTSDGLDPRERGQLIHKVMELIWQHLESQAALLSLYPQDLDKQIDTAILAALEPLIAEREYSFSPLIQEVELVRLRRLVYACLDWEKQRPPFKVEALEQAFTINLAGMDFRVRVDRLDSLEDNKKWVIDYKSSLPQSFPWKEERPKEPQLLLYALLDETINGLLFAQLKAGQLSAKGLTEDDHSKLGLSTVKKGETWAEYRQHWQAQLNELATEFSQGHCPPQPASSSICQQCDFQNLCRFSVL